MKVSTATSDCDVACRQKLMEWNFDPNDVSRSTNEWYTSALLGASNIYYGVRTSPPIVLFAQLGDLVMLRYILRNSQYPPHQELRRIDECGLFPLYTAISEPHSQDDILKVCQWLYQQGANLKQTVGNEWSPLARACLKGYEKVALWLIQSGALLRSQSDDDDNNNNDTNANEDVVFDANLAQRDLPRFGEYEVGGCDTLLVTRFVHNKIFAWARHTLATRESFGWVLLGTISSNDDSIDDSDQCPQNTMRSPLCALNGHPGLLEHIAGFVGVSTSRHILITARGLVAHCDVWRCRAVNRT